MQAQSRRDGQLRWAAVSPEGWYTLLNLPPARYRLRACFTVQAGGCGSNEQWQAREVANLDVPVGGLMRIDLRLRPMGEVYDQGEGLRGDEDGTGVVRRFEGDRRPDRWVLLTGPRQVYRTLEATLSNTSDPREMRELPYLGRDAYTLLATQVTASSEVSAARGLGLSLAGLRPGTGSFLLDGQNVTSGILAEPLVALAPEAIGEYRTSLANYGVEFGRAAGSVTNAVSQGGGLAWHGIAYAHGGARILNANEFARNAQGRERLPFREQQIGTQMGGPWGRVRLGGAFDWTLSESASGEQAVRWPRVPGSFGAPSEAAALIARYLPAGKMGSEELQPPVDYRRWSALGRVESALPWTGSTGFVRVMGAGRDWKNFVWSPFPEFVSGLGQPAWAAVASATVARGSWTQEVRLGWARERVGWARAQDALPTLRLLSGEELPGSPAQGGYEYRRGTGEGAYGWTRVGGRHLWKAGGQLFVRGSRVENTAGVQGRIDYDDLAAFNGGRATRALLGVRRGAVTGGRLTSVAAPLARARTAGSDGAIYGEDRIRLGRGTALHLGLRTERKSGLGFWPTRWRMEGRTGLNHTRGAWNWRSAYGVFADQPSDSLWLPVAANDLLLVTVPLTATRFWLPREERYAELLGQRVVPVRDQLPTRLAADLGRGYAQHALVGTAWNPSQRWSAEANGLVVTGRRLVVSDEVDRARDPMTLRSGSGGSRYAAVMGSVRYQGGGWVVQGNYTAARGWDHQSDPYGGAMGDLDLIAERSLAQRRIEPALMVEGDTSRDWGRAAYVQGHSLSLVGLWRSISTKWQVSTIAQVRSGLPYTVYRTRVVGEALRNPRAALIAGARPETREPLTGGERLLDAAAFQGSAGVDGLPRGSFTNPGGFSWDVSGQRVLVVRERWRVALRTDWFNVLNHANLGPVINTLPLEGVGNFGESAYGRRAGGTGLPFVTPAEDAARQIRVMLRVEF